MEEADKVSSSSAPDEAPHDIAIMNEAGQTRDAEEERTEETSSPQTTEVTSSPQTTEVTNVSASQTTEVTSSSQTTDEVTSSPQINEETNSPQPAEVIVTPEMAEESVTPEKLSEVPVKQTSTEAEVTSTSQTHPAITEAAVTPKTAEESVTPHVTEAVTKAEESVTPHVTAVTNAEESVTSPVTEAVTNAEEIVTPFVTEITSEVTSSQQTVMEEERVTPVKSAESPAPEISSSCSAHTHTLSSDAREEEKEKQHPHTLHPSSSSNDPEPPSAPGVAPALSQPQFPSDCWDSPSVASQASELTMDSLGHKDSTGFDPDVLSQSDDDFMFETKKSPFQAFSPLNDGLGETPADSPSPDLVQDAYDGEEAHAQSESRQAKQELSLSYASDVNTASDDRPMSLPDILKSSPMNPEKVDSGSSEGSPEFSPAHRRGNDPPKSPFSASANILDSKILLLKEMAEVTEARAAAEKAKLAEHNNSEQSFVAFDLVKETDVPQKTDSLLKDKVEVLSQTSVQTAPKFDCLNFPLGKAQEQWDSESPSADSFSPVLDAVPPKPSSFSAEQERRDEASEPEPSSEEFEFIERPTRGAAEDFLEMQDSLTFMKPASEVLLDEDRSPELESVAEEEDQISYHLPTPASDKSSAGRGKAGLESDLQELSPTPVTRPPGDQAGSGKRAAEAEGIPMPDRSAAAVLQLLRWRDVRWSALVFGSSLFLLLSLTCFSIISILSYSALALLSASVSFRVYKGVLQAIQKSDDGHPFRCVLEKDLSVSSEAVQRHSDVVLGRVNGALKELRRLFLVEDLVDSLKFGGLLWVFTYVGSWFNGLTLLILALIGAFSGPITYEKHQAEIDQFISSVRSQMRGVLGMIQGKVPGAKKKPE
ncbi:reticulon-4b isoform X4 [Pimephales promelas]|uniref:reticulon-4b isoform X4 n=1 Tax=Pimephales promelas TaxID=90988 RepID=UPI001955D97F|nr:reticulon-4b isoform X4 [Pimephales promelas]